MSEDLHPSLDPNINGLNADGGMDQSCAGLEYVIEQELAQLREQHAYRMQVNAFVTLIQEIRTEVRLNTARIERLMEIIAGEIGATR